ncbi:MAG: hypothetical protein VX466_12830 [Myxococcota bacterium]|nr:hypothetical protein [Myxococcota bacterium]
MLVRKRFAVAVAVLSIVLAPAAALAEADRIEPREAAVMTFDLLVLRPAGLARFVLGSAIATVVLPFALISGQTEEIVEQLIGEPGAYTFQRKLGDF